MIVHFIQYVMREYKDRKTKMGKKIVGEKAVRRKIVLKGKKKNEKY